MTTRVRIEIRCDHPGCSEGVAFERTNLGGLNVTQAQRFATRMHGWHTAGKRQFCPDHAAAHRV